MVVVVVEAACPVLLLLLLLVVRVMVWSVKSESEHKGERLEVQELDRRH